MPDSVCSFDDESIFTSSTCSVSASFVTSISDLVRFAGEAERLLPPSFARRPLLPPNLLLSRAAVVSDSGDPSPVLSAFIVRVAYAALGELPGVSGVGDLRDEASLASR
jgi:hypothetical protein